MLVKKMKELYSVDTISQDKGWKRIQEALPEGEEIMIDFQGVNVVDPWDCVEFKRLLKNPLVHMKFVNEDEMVRRIKIMCVVEGLDDNRVVNEIVEIPKEKTAEEKKIERIGTELIDSFEIVGDTAKFVARNKYSQLHSASTLSYIKFAIEKIVEKGGIKTVILDLNSISVLRNVIELVADMLVDLKKIDVDLIVDITDKESINNLKLFIHQATNKKYTDKDRTRAILKHLKKNTAVILVKYKKSKALDEFGRHGNGEIISSRIALFREIKMNSKGQDMVIIDSFNDKYFYTKQHWMVEHDNEIPVSLHAERLEIPVMEIGYGDLFLGSDYHFMAPVQQSNSENRTVIVDVDDNGNNVKIKCTIPERIREVFDDWHIEYDQTALDLAIEETKKLLNER